MSRSTPDLIREVQLLNYDLIQLKNTQVVGASTLLVQTNQTSDTYDFNDTIPSGWNAGGVIDFAADNQDFPFAELDCDIYIDNVLVKLGEGEHLGGAGIGFSYYKAIRPDDNVVSFVIAITNFSASSKNYKLKFRVKSTDTGQVFPAIIANLRYY